MRLPKRDEHADICTEVDEHVYADAYADAYAVPDDDEEEEE